jgi:hypothetical protein
LFNCLTNNPRDSIADDMFFSLGGWRSRCRCGAPDAIKNPNCRDFNLCV